MIVSELMGGMGNQMFQYALGRHLAIKNNTELFLDIHFLQDRTPRKDFTYRNYDLDIFNVKANFAPPEIAAQYGFCRSRLKKYIQKFINPGDLQCITEEAFQFSPAVFNSGDNIYLNGYWQTEKYFKDIEGIIRQEFTFKENIGEKAKAMADKIQHCNAVCLHVRRGDFVTNPTHGITSLDYYLTAEKRIRETIHNPVFFVFSDDINWCRQNIQLSSETHFVGQELSGEKSRDHFQLMTCCKHFVIPNSSFGWWAAWLSVNEEKIVITPRTWFHNSIWNTTDLIPDKWIKI